MILSIGVMWIAGMVIILLVSLALMYNGFIRYRHMVEEAFATMDVYLKKRYELVPNLVNAVKGYMSYEKDTLEQLVLARNNAINAAGMEEKIDSEDRLSKSLKSLFALSEGYPELKADTQVTQLQQQLKTCEEDIANARKYYNAVAKKMNIKVQSFPNNLVAGLFGFQKVDYFNIHGDEREKVEVKL